MNLRNEHEVRVSLRPRDEGGAELCVMVTSDVADPRGGLTCGVRFGRLDGSRVATAVPQ